MLNHQIIKVLIFQQIYTVQFVKREKNVAVTKCICKHLIEKKLKMLIKTPPYDFSNVHRRSEFHRSTTARAEKKNKISSTLCKRSTGRIRIHLSHLRQKLPFQTKSGQTHQGRVRGHAELLLRLLSSKI